MTAPAPRPGDVTDAARRAVRDLLMQSPGYADAEPELKRDLARKMVGVALLSADLAAEELGLPRRPPPRAVAQDVPVNKDFAAVKSAASTVAALRKAIDFPNFVTSLINGVFQAISTANLQQITAIAELLDNVQASADDFTMRNVDDQGVLRWSVAKFPFLQLDGTSLAVKEGVELSDMRATLKNGLEANDDQVNGIDGSDLESTFLPLARAKMGKERQQILGTLIQMGLQRIVVDEGRLHASMDMRVDAKSVAQQQAANQRSDALAFASSASGAVGPFSGSASVSTSHAEVHSDTEMTKDEIAARAGLRSSVDLAFRTEQVPLDKFANEKARVKLNAKALVPADISGKDSILGPDEKMPAPPALPNAGTPTPTPAKSAPEPAKDAAPKAAPAKPDAKADAKPAGAKPGDAKPGNAKPGDAKAGDAKPGDAKADGKPNPGDGKPAPAKENG